MSVVREIVAHPAIFPHVHDDYVTECNPQDIEACHWLLVLEDDTPKGCFMVHANNGATYEIHTCLLPEIWGRKASEAAQLLLKYMFEELGCLKAVTNVPAYNKKALHFAMKNGLKIEGINRESYLKNGVLEDQIFLGITKKEYLSCQH